MYVTSTVPMLAVAPHPFLTGANAPDERCEPLTLMNAQTALQTAWKTDAHLVSYTTGTGQPFPRLNKACLPQLRQRAIDVKTQLFVFDYDNPGHQQWETIHPQTGQSITKAGFLQTLNQLYSTWSFAASCALLYSTRSGARLVYFLDKPISVDQAEGKLRWMVAQFHQCGFMVDRLCDWTRLFRLPFVHRDGKNSWEFDPEILWMPNWDARINADSIPSIDRGDIDNNILDIIPFGEKQPDDAEALSLLTTRDAISGRLNMSQFMKEARKALKGRECYPCLFDNAVMAEPGARNETLHKYVSQAIGMLYPSGITPTHIYAIFYECVSHLERDHQTNDWFQVLWGMIGRVWQKEDARARAKQQQKELAVEDTLELVDQIAQGMREWCDHPDVHCNEPAIVHSFVSRHLIVSHHDSYYVMKPSGTYCKNAVTATSLVPEIKRLGMDSLIAISKMNEDGAIREIERAAITRQHCTLVRQVLVIPQRDGGVVSQIGTDNAMLESPSYRRNPNLEPQFSPEVDAWLNHAFGEDTPRVVNWIGHALDFEGGPICALSVVGEPGIGKKILVNGLSETLENPAEGGDADMTGDYNYSMLESPFVVIDEGWSVKGGSKSAADEFRRLVAGKKVEVKRKFLAPVHAYNPARVIITANDLSTVRQLVAGRELGPAGRKSIEDRLLHISLAGRRDGAVWLEAMGGLNYTGRKGGRWIAGDGDGKSDFIVARHFLYLHQNRGPRMPGRLLVMGNVDKEIMYEFRTADSANQRVVESILRMLKLPAEPEGMCVTDNRIFVLSAAVLQFYRNVLSRESGDKLNISQVTRAIEHFTLVKWTYSFALKGGSKMRWHEIDPQLLHEAAREQGIECPKLTNLMYALEQLGLKNGIGGVL